MSAKIIASVRFSIVLVGKDVEIFSCDPVTSDPKRSLLVIDIFLFEEYYRFFNLSILSIFCPIMAIKQSAININMWDKTKNNR